jgi:signal transduction histidine kinase
VTLGRSNGDLEIRVEDNGAGFDATATDQGGGLGLVGMRERAALVSGRLALESERGSGTRIRVLLPVGDEAHE